MPRKALVGLLFALGSLSAIGQAATGLYPYGSFDSPGFDQIDRGSLNVHFSIPVASKAGRGLPFGYSLVYDGLIWVPSSASGTTAWTPDPAFGLHGYALNDGYKGYISYNVAYEKCYDGGTLLGNYPNYSNYVYHDAVGVNHVFTLKSNTCSGAQTGSGTATDGSGYSTNGAAVISTVRGDQIVVPQYVNGAPGATNGSTTDSNGNEVTSTQAGVFTDTTGKNILTISGTGTASSPKVFTYLTPTGTAKVTITYKTHTVQTSFGCGFSEYNKSADLPDRVTLADGSYYQFGYEPSPANSANTTGRLASLRLPPGGTMSYTYPGSITCADGTPSGLKRVTSDGTIQYTRSAIASASSHTEVIDAANNHSEFDFVRVVTATTSFYETQQAVYNGANTGTALVSRQTCYNGNTSACTTTVPGLPISQIDTYETLDGVQEHGHTLKFNALGLQTERDDYFFSANTRGPIIQKEVWAYPTSGIANLVSSDTITDQSNNQVSQLSYGYDETAPAATSGLPQHTSAPSTQRGNLTSVHQWVNTPSTPSLSTTIKNDDAGQIQSSTNESGTTNYAYDSTDTFSTTVTPPTPASGVSLPSGAQYDIGSGVLLNTTDPNLQKTTYGNFDSFGRPLAITDPAGGIDYFAINATYMGHDHNVDGSNARLSTTTYYDGYGRPSYTAESNGQSQSYRVDTCYDSSGRQSFTSLPYFSTGGSNVCSGSGTATMYDALSRPTKVTQADGSTLTYSYSGRATKTVDENGVTRIQQVDGLGRMAYVCEISSNGQMPSSGQPASCGLDIAGSGFLTNYTYDTANHKVTVTQGNQTRIFQTDSLGRTIMTQEPEMSSASGQGKATYSYAYSGGELTVTRTRPLQNQTNPSTTTTQVSTYDALGRLRFVHYTDGGLTPDFEQLWDTPHWSESSPQTNLKGNVSVINTGNSGTQYSYDATGRVLTMWEIQPTGWGQASGWTRELDFTYDYAGRLTSQGDPTTGNIHFAYSPASEITGVTNSSYGDTYNPPTYVSSVVNGPFGPTSYHLGNGLNAVNSYDSAGRTNGKWLCSGTTSAYCSGGTQLYGTTQQWNGHYLTNGIDTVMNTGGPYSYDEFGRLKSFSSNVGQATSFTWNYDRWGNRWSQTPGDSVMFDPTTNHLVDSSITYDAVGNLIKDSHHSYSYDQNGNLLSVDAGNTASYIYDALNQRVQIKIPSASPTTLEFTYDFAGRRITTWNAIANSGIQGQAWWGATPLAYRGTFGHTYFQQGDWEGTQRLLTDYAGSPLSSYKSNPFGDGYSASSTDENRLHFAGTEHDAESGTDHAQFRQYNTNIGNWMSLDPYAGSYDFTNPQSLNRYTYALNNPLSFVDPSGLDCVAEENGNFNCTTNGPSCDTNPFASGCPPPTFPCQEYGFCYGQTGSAPGSGGGGGGGTGTPQKPVLPYLAALSNGRKLDPNGQDCKSLAKKIDNLVAQIQKRQTALDTNPLNLPMTAAGPLKNSVQGHQQLLNVYIQNLANAANDYNNKCGGGPPGAPSSGFSTVGSTAPSLPPGVVPAILVGVGVAGAVSLCPECLIVAPFLAP